MVIFVNVVTVIARSASGGENNGTQFGEVDDFFPLVIYYLIKVHPRMLKSTLRFIKLFRNPERLVAAEGYYHSLMLSAVDFIERINTETVGIDANEFRAKYSECERMSMNELEEQVSIWQYQPEEEPVQENRKLRHVVKEITKMLDITPCKFENTTFEQLKEIVEAQAMMIEKLKNISI
eukprot:TRINITY_DN13577_c0_g3_i1.p1 TRINITY_DN13577_c0_g3~~TRINITY_DN13577_c0_g3_i1.p1  ORF type:complete len:179 (+),score=33.32 TRINITY_DN13577_c0_g3_i1:609-1145(+)